MRRVTTAIKSQGFIWDFSAGDSGAIAVYTSPISIPITAFINDVNVVVQTGIVGGAAAAFSITWAGNVNIVSFGNIVPIGGFSFVPLCVPAVTSNATVFLNILANTFTAGRFIMEIRYVDSANR